MNYDICMVVHDDVLHDSRIWREARSLDAAGWRVVVVCISLGTKRLPAVQPVDGFTIWRVSPGIFRNQSTVKTTRKLIQLLLALPIACWRIRQSEARVFHANDFTGLVMVALAGIWRRPVVYDSHELFFDRAFRGIPRWIILLLNSLRPLEKFLAQRSAAFLATSESHADRLVENLDMPRPIIVRNAVDLRRLGECAAAYPQTGQRLVAHSGSLLDGRHLPELVEALKFLPDDVALVLMGQGVLRGRLQHLAESLQVADRLHFIPAVQPDDVAPTLAQAAVAVVLITGDSLSYQFSLPNKFFEAVAAGLPLVVSSIPELAHMVEQYDIGLICDPTNPADIAEKIMILLQPEHLTQYRANVEKARAELNWEQEEQKLIEVYRPLFEQSHA